MIPQRQPITSRVLNDITRTINGGLVTRPIAKQQPKPTRSKSLCNDKYRITSNNLDHSLTRLNKQQPTSIQNARHRASIDYPCDSKVMQQSTSNNYACNIFDLWSVPIKDSNQPITMGKKAQKHHSNSLLPLQKSLSFDITSMAQNQHSYLLIDSNKKFHALSKDTLTANLNMQTIINTFCQRNTIEIKQLHSTQFATFFIDQNEKLYAMGLNDRGQLGIGSKVGVIDYPVQVPLGFLSEKNRSFGMRNKPSYADEKIKKIIGGPFHTVLLTSSHRAFHTGLQYTESALQTDSYTPSFIQLQTKTPSPIVDIKCGLTSLVFLTSNHKIYLKGLFGENIFSEETQLDFGIRDKPKQFEILGDCVYVLTETGSVYVADLKRRLPVIKQLNFNDMCVSDNRKIEGKKYQPIRFFIESMHVSNNHILFAAKQHSIAKTVASPYCYFLHSIVEEQSTPKTMQLELSYFKQTLPQKILITQNNIYCLINKSASQQLQNSINSQPQKAILPQTQIDNFMKKIKQLEEENNKLKKENLLLSRNKKQREKTPNKSDKTLSSSSNINYNFDKQVNPRTFSQDLQIDFKELKLVKKIAEGGYGIIYKGQWKRTEVAVKIFKIDEHNTNAVKEFISQCRAMQALRHPNIVMFLGACMKPPNFAIVLEYCEGGTLWSLLQNHRIQLPWKQRIGLALGTAKAINYLHDRKNPIVHRDLKSLNVLLDGNRKVKLADFGWTKSLENYMTSKIGTYQWMAPEVLTGQKYTQKADVFSFSIILWQIASRQPPYRNINGLQVAYDVANKEYRPDIPEGTPKFFDKLIVDCWDKEPQKRPSFRDIIDLLQKQINNVN